MTTEKLFSYGTLQYEAVQLDTFGRKLSGQKDVLLGYRLETVEIHDPKVIALSGEAIHKMLLPTNNNKDTVEGMVFDLTPEELVQADAYEVDAYKRVRVQLQNTGEAWAYVSAAH